MPWTIDSYAGMLYRQHTNNVFGANSGYRAIVKRFKLLKRWKEETLFLAEILGYKNRLPLLNIGGYKFYFITKPFSVRRRLVDSLIIFILSIMFII
jgi:rhamnosyltransferase